MEEQTIKRRFQRNHKWKKMSVPSSIPSGTSTRKRTRREVNGRQEQSRKSSLCSSRKAVASEERSVRTRQFRSWRTSPYELRSRRQFSERPEQFRRSRVQPYYRRSKGAAHKRVQVSKINWRIALAENQKV
ncbi:hypothetical protein TNCT_229771 [Trichonephila clavata]|uniref:Uncharacterized protein n=1 Tax=Trichonephila clavata TaxID=2740835 RepID=A0A8X6JCE1_TRICU|nr:hypothetical protein TNCT_229771 [Trichonephila clavata]